ncbi:BQ5605_C026g10131 [Microbotryum silenes-dioicae]|uniref:BQ5605_C026g10131 protein n=1 Tax=Microbotryum silenes-dioicae TaxID=796604 RepID=A0A2X0NFF0_9BASI|nr:BQ5605_C026g10131 [Microbotryum silenes-dioicae]
MKYSLFFIAYVVIAAVNARLSPPTLSSPFRKSTNSIIPRSLRLVEYRTDHPGITCLALARSFRERVKLPIYNEDRGWCASRTAKTEAKMRNQSSKRSIYLSFDPGCK